jgi:hypothetical protein
MQLTDHQTHTIINALRAAAELYQRDAELNTGDERIVAQFRKQTVEAENLAVLLEEAGALHLYRSGAAEP